MQSQRANIKNLVRKLVLVLFELQSRLRIVMKALKDLRRSSEMGLDCLLS